MKISSAAGVIVAGLALTIGGTAVAAPVAAGMQGANQSSDVPTQVAGPKAAQSNKGDLLGVKLRVINDTDHGVTPFYVQESSGARHELQPGQHYDVSGQAYWWGQKDVTATVRSGPQVFSLWGYNPDIGYPSVGVGNSWERYSVGESHTRVLSDYKVKVTRQADEDFKLFTIAVSRK